LAALMFGLAIQTGRAQNRAPGPPWTCSLDALEDVPTLCKEGSGSGLRLYVTDVIAQSTTTTAGLFNLLASPKTAAGSADCIAGGDPPTLFPAGLTGGTTRFAAPASTAKPLMRMFPKPLIVPSGSDLCAVGDPSNPVTVQLVGYLAP
jgi:hypothetical protein